MNYAAIFHRPSSEYAFALDDTHYVFRLRAQAGDLTACALWYADRAAMGPLCYRRAPMEKRYADVLADWFELRLTTQLNRIAYYFELCDGARTAYYIGGLFQPTPQADRSDGFQFAYNHRADRLTVPEWAADAVVYNIFPDSFASRAGYLARQPQSASLGGETCRSLLGGTLRGIRENLDAIERLGCNCLYLNPIFAAGCYHKYDTLDYFRVDPCFGTGEDLRRLVHAAHARGMRVILDGVFNHVSSRHPFFQDVLARGRQSRYYRWFYGLPEHPRLPAEGELPEYACFSYVADMPKTDLSCPEACAYFCEVGRYWIETFDIDGWRLDVSPEVYPDFWRQFRRAVMAANPNAIMIAECWHDSREWCTVGDMFDGTMHYVLSEAIWKFFADRRWSLAQFDAGINRAMMLYPQEVQNSMWNFLSSHDTARMLTRCGGRVKSMRAAAFFQMTHPGVPVIYYGDELGMRGGPDPDCRRSMTWDKVNGNAMLAYYKRLTHMRNASEVLREGTLKTWEVGEDGLYAYLRQTEKETVLCALNTTDQAIRRMVRVPEELAACKTVCDLLSGKTHKVQGGYVTLTLGACEGVALGRAEA